MALSDIQHRILTLHFFVPLVDTYSPYHGGAGTLLDSKRDVVRLYEQLCGSRSDAGED